MRIWPFLGETASLNREEVKSIDEGGCFEDAVGATVLLVSFEVCGGEADITGIILTPRWCQATSATVVWMLRTMRWTRGEGWGLLEVLLPQSWLVAATGSC